MNLPDFVKNKIISKMSWKEKMLCFMVAGITLSNSDVLKRSTQYKSTDICVKVQQKIFPELAPLTSFVSY